MAKDNLQKYRKFLVTYELMALLHDIGKLNDSFKNEDDKIIHPFMTHIPVALKEFGFEYLSGSRVDIKDIDRSLVDTLNSISEDDSLKEFFKLKWSELKFQYPTDILTSLKDNNEVNPIGQVATHHQYKRYAMPDSILEFLTCEADSWDAAEDRTCSKWGMKGLPGFFVSSPFGSDNRDKVDDKAEDASSKTLRLEIYDKLLGIIKKYSKNHDRKTFLADSTDEEVKQCRQEIFELKNYFTNISSMTRIPDNDTTLWNHSFMTASIGKAFVGNFLLKDEEEQKEIVDNIKTLRNIKKNKRQKAVFLLHEGNIKVKKQYNQYTSDNPYRGSFNHKNVAKDKIYWSVIITDKNDKTRKFTVNRQFGTHSNDGESNNQETGYFYFNKVFGNDWNVNVMDCLLGITHVLAVQFPGREFLTNVYRLPDFIARENILQEIREELRKLLEFTIPVGNCVFEDVNGMYFLVPDLNIDNELIKEITVEIENIFQEKTKDLIIPNIVIEACDLSSGKFLIGPTLTSLRKKYEENRELEATPYKMKKLKIPEWTTQWQDKSNAETCVVCGKKPGYKDDAYNDIICPDCKLWRIEKVKKSTGVKMLDQIKDNNDRIALLVGEIGLYDSWLNGSYVKTTANYRYKYVKSPDDKQVITSADLVLKNKEPSPSRLMRIVEEIDGFIENLVIQDNLPGLNGIVLNGKCSENASGYYEHRWDMSILDKLLKNNNVHNYLTEMKFVDNINLKELSETIKYWFTDCGKSTLEIICYFENFEFVFAYPEKIKFADEELSISWQRLFEDYLNELKISNKNFIKKKNRSNNEFIISSVDKKLVKKYRVVYTKADQFMILLPANQALKVAQVLNEEFKTRFNKVQGRLSLNLGLIFADRKYPLYLILKAGIVMMKNIKTLFDDYSTKVNKDKVILAKGLKAKIVKADLINDDSDLKVEIEFEQKPFIQEKTEVIIKRKIKPYEPYEKVTNQKSEYDLFYPYFIDANGEAIRTFAISEEEKKEIEKEVKKRKEAIVEKQKDSSKIIEIVDGFKLDSIHLGEREKYQIAYAPNTIDFENLITNGSRSGLSMDHKSAKGKRKHYANSKFKVRPYLTDNLWILASVKGELIKAGISSGIIVRLSQAFLNEIGILKDIKKDEILLDEIISMLLGNISEFKNLDEGLLDKLSILMKTGQIFDLVELWSVLNVI